MRVCSFFLIIFVTNSAADAWDKNWTNGSHFKFVENVHLSENATLLVPSVKYVKEGPESFGIYCFPNVHKSIFQVWRSVQFTVWFLRKQSKDSYSSGNLVLLDVPFSFDIFLGSNETEVHENYNSKSIWHSSLFSSSDTVIDFPAFFNYCVGIATSEKYSLSLNVRTINYWKVLQTLLGSFLFLASPNLSRNPFFHYVAGVTLGVLASFLILLYFLSRFIPQRSASYAVLVFGYSFIFYFFKIMWHHFHDILTQYMDIVLGYCIFMAFLSFVVCYRLGPVKSDRTLNIIQWSMQAFALLLIFFSSEYREVSTAMILLMLTIRMIPATWIKWIKFLWYRCFPPKVKLLSELEYIEQGHIETKKALEDLRKFCSSPDCNTWKLVRNLKNPTRFAEFMRTGHHYTDEELLDYNSEDFDESISNGITDENF